MISCITIYYDRCELVLAVHNEYRHRREQKQQREMDLHLLDLKSDLQQSITQIILGSLAYML
jgi:hypothetical protein